MIPHQNLFSGALGKLQNTGGSRIYTTPHTVSVPAEYSINVTYNVQGVLVGHSQDGRLWLFRRSRRLGIIALKWNAAKGQLEYAAAQNLSNNDDVVLACGLDWVLTNNNIFMVDDDGAIRSAQLFDANIPDSYLYSILRAGNIGASGIDPFTGLAWGMRDDNGNSEGSGYFSKSTHLLYPAGAHTFEQCYSLLPAVGDWQIFENFLVRRPDAETINSYNYMQAVRPLIPLEFCKGSVTYGTGYNFNHSGIQLFHRNGNIFGKGYQNIGKVSLLPAVFSQDNSVQEYYLYISPDFILFPYSDFFYCHIFTFDVSVNDEVSTHSFAVSYVSRTWAQAKAICEALGGHLATSTNAEKNAFLVSLIGNNTVWLGGSDEETEGTWKWISGEEWNYTNWNSGEPNNSNNEDYVELQSSGGWNDNKATTSHDYVCEWDYVLDENDFFPCLWNNIAIASIGTDSLYGFLLEQPNALTSAACFTSTDGHVLIPQTGDFLTLSENNGCLFFDALSYKGLLLDDNGGQFLLGEGISDTQNIVCKTLPQWLAPAGKIDTVTDDYIVASADNSAFCTSLLTGFNRQFLSPNTIPLTARAFQDSNEDFHRLAISVGDNQNSRKLFGVNQILSQDVTPKAILWQDIYKEAVKLQFLNAFEHSFLYTMDFDDGTYRLYDVSYSSSSKCFNIMPIFGFERRMVVAPILLTRSYKDNIEYRAESVSGNTITTNETLTPPSGYIFNRYKPQYDEDFAIPLRASQKIFFVNPDSGQPSDSYNIEMTCNYHFFTYGDDNWGYETRIQTIEVPQAVGVKDNKIGWFYKVVDFTESLLVGKTSSLGFRPVMGVPENIKNWCNIYDYTRNTEYPTISLLFREFSEHYAIFLERITTTLFAQKLDEEIFSDMNLYRFFEFPFLLEQHPSSGGLMASNQNLHIMILTDANYEDDFNAKFLVFRSKLQPDVFDFYSQSERSKLS